jgi:hypothetical protein
LTPLRSGYIFSPSGRTIALSGDDLSGLKFVAQEVIGSQATYTLSGTVQTEDGQPLSGVQVDIEPSMVGPVTTNAAGRYAFTDLQQGTYTVRPHQRGYVFEPGEITIALTDDVGRRDFIGERKLSANSVAISTHVPWEQWYQFYNDIIDPLMSVGAEIKVQLQLTAKAEQALGSDLLERLRDSVQGYDEDAEVEAS